MRARCQQFFVDNLDSHRYIAQPMYDSLLAYRKPNQLNRFFTTTLNQACGGRGMRKKAKTLQTFLWACRGRAKMVRHKKRMRGESKKFSSVEWKTRVVETVKNAIGWLRLPRDAISDGCRLWLTRKERALNMERTSSDLKRISTSALSGPLRTAIEEEMKFETLKSKRWSSDFDLCCWEDGRNR